MKQSKNIRVPRFKIGDKVLVYGDAIHVKRGDIVGIVVEITDMRYEWNKHRNRNLGNFNFTIKFIRDNYNKYNKDSTGNFCIAWLELYKIDCPKYLKNNNFFGAL